MTGGLCPWGKCPGGYMSGGVLSCHHNEHVCLSLAAGVILSTSCVSMFSIAVCICQQYSGRTEENNSKANTTCFCLYLIAKSISFWKFPQL